MSFARRGSTVRVAVTTASQAIPLPDRPTPSGGTIRIYNAGPDPVFYALGTAGKWPITDQFAMNDSGVWALNDGSGGWGMPTPEAVVVPSQGGAANGMIVPVDCIEWEQIGTETHIYLICAAGNTADVFVTGGAE